ncbi:DUF6150 family protein [Mesonia sp. K7]|uniref:DUF6150 family protein n=1 Tax=Mesonia sp. K7 TaxID=2218606 RepID=UPI000DA80DD4|nr:DUF6150 family protein [Mesonia sp. K7]PZD79165.1 hypothetical protein DNG35_03930 [Mesonia sp. K7]
MKHFTILLFLFVNLGFSQEVYKTDNKTEADYIVYTSEEKSEADWIVMKTTWRNQAENGKWYFTEWKKGCGYSTMLY